MDNNKIFGDLALTKEISSFPTIDEIGILPDYTNGIMEITESKSNTNEDPSPFNQ